VSTDTHVRRDIPQPPDAGVLNGLRFGTDPLRFLDAVQARYPDAVEVPIPGRPPLVVVTNPDLVHDALGRPEAFGRISGDGLGLPADNGLVQSEGDLWRQQRSIMLPAFVGQQVVAYGDTAGQRSVVLGDRLGRAAADGRTVDLHREMTTLTIRVASEILLGEDVGRERAATFHEWMQVATDELAISPSGIAPDWLPLPNSPEYEAAAGEMQAMAEEVIDRRRATLADGGEPGADMLSLLLSAEDDPTVEYPPNQIRDEVLTFLIAGHETTALSLTYTLSLLSAHPEVRQRVREEARSVLGDATPRYEHADDLPYTTRVFREALRLYPAAWAVFREANAEVRLGDYRVKDGSAMIFPQYSIHRDGRYFAAPETFDPDRWERRDPDAVDAYFPFGSGPHACIGRQFALTGATLTTASLIRDLDVRVDEGALDDLQATITLRPRDEVNATVERAE
jgi:cytochrome P450